jgi:hypothetical protein
MHARRDSISTPSDQLGRHRHGDRRGWVHLDVGREADADRDAERISFT